MQGDVKLPLCNLFTLDIDQAFPWTPDWQEILADVTAMTIRSGIQADLRPGLHLRYSQHLSTDGMRELEPQIFIGKNALVDRTYGIRLERGSEGDVVLTANNPALEWMAWGLQMAFLARHSTMIHGAAVAKGNKALIFPSWGGVGKTGLVCRMVREDGWSLLGDDFSVLTADGVCHAFPKPMVLYPYHRALFPEVFEHGRGPLAPPVLTNPLYAVGRVLKPLLRHLPPLLRMARKLNPQSVQILPSEVFRADQLAAKAQVHAVVWLERVAGLKEPELILSTGDLPSRIMGSTLNEFDPRCVRTTHTAMGLGLVRFEDFYATWNSVLGRGLSQAQHAVLCIPDSVRVESVADVVYAVLKDTGIWVG